MSFSCVPLDQCTCDSKHYEGDRRATTTFYTSGESQGIGSCGGCLYPKCPNCGGPDGSHSYENMFDALQNISSDIPWTMAATAESMMGAYCPGSKGMGCVGRPSPQGKTADAPCGTCWELTNQDGHTINVAITDACPYEDNQEWCPKNAGDINQHNYYNHFDVWNGHTIPGWGINPEITFRSIPCPPQVQAILKDGCCGTYYDDGAGGGQGCPSICGSTYQCPPGDSVKQRSRSRYHTVGSL